MSKYKTNFALINNDRTKEPIGEASIIGVFPESKPYITVAFKNSEQQTRVMGWFKDKDLERFAVNILRALNSKKLRP